MTHPNTQPTTDSRDDVSLHELIRIELAGKKVAMGRYDAILWQIRSGYMVVLFGTLGFLTGKDKALELNMSTVTVESPAYAINPMVGYLEEGGTTSGRKHLEALLELSAPGYPKAHQLADPCAQALGRIGHPDSIPFIKRAAAHGVERAIEAPIHLGDMDSFDMLFRTYIAAKTPASQPNALHWLVRRSNRPVEAWMHPSSYTTDDGIAMKPKWTAWWEKHRKGMEIVADIHAAQRAWKREYASP